MRQFSIIPALYIFMRTYIQFSQCQILLCMELSFPDSIPDLKVAVTNNKGMLRKKMLDKAWYGSKVMCKEHFYQVCTVALTACILEMSSSMNTFLPEEKHISVDPLNCITTTSLVLLLIMVKFCILMEITLEISNGICFQFYKSWMRCAYVKVLLNLSKISATVHIAIPVLEFLSTLISLPKVWGEAWLILTAVFISLPVGCFS